MSGSVSTRWYFSDWMSDPNVRTSSLAARGLWIDMLCFCAANRGRSYGYLAIAGKAIEPAHLARLVGAPERDVVALLDELEQNGVFSRTRTGTIYCRRMIRAAKYRDNGRLGGNPNLMNGKGNKKRVRVEPNLPPESGTLSSLSSSRVSESKAGEGIGEFLPLGDSSETLSSGAAESEQASLAKWKFEKFWRQYPHKVGKRAAVKAFDAAKKRKASFDDLMLGLMRYAAKDDERPWCNPATFLNQERWLDEPAPNGGSNVRRDETIAERTSRLVEHAKRLEAEAAARRAGRAF